MIRPYVQSDFSVMLTLINAAAEAYRGVIPCDCWTEPYMPAKELEHEISEGVEFWGFENARTLIGVMGMQEVKDVTLIRHAYVSPSAQRQGIGETLLANCRKLTERPLLIGTWADAEWAIQFYQKHGFQIIPPHEKAPLLSNYWTIPQRQIETSVVLGDPRWFERKHIS